MQYEARAFNEDGCCVHLFQKLLQFLPFPSMKAPKTVLLLLPVAVLATVFAADPLADLSLTKEQAERLVADTITNGMLFVPSSARQLPEAERVEVVKAMGTFAKNYVATDDFKMRYQQWWQAREPQPPQTLESKEEERRKKEAQEKEQQARGMTDMAAQLAKMPESPLKQQLMAAQETALKAQEEVKAQMESPEMKKIMEQAAEMNRKGEAERYQKDLADYQAKHAEWLLEKDPNTLIKKGLERLLAETEGVDFEAAVTTDVSGMTVFVNPDYQKKPPYWKQAFRAGRPTVEAARAFAREWLKSL
jgi:hypothetical protein